MQGTLEGPRTTGPYVELRKESHTNAPQVRGDPGLLPLQSVERPLPLPLLWLVGCGGRRTPRPCLIRAEPFPHPKYYHQGKELTQGGGTFLPVTGQWGCRAPGQLLLSSPSPGAPQGACCLKWTCSHLVVSNSATPWTIAYQALPSMEFSRQEYWSGLPFPSPGDLPIPGIEPRSPALGDALPSEPPGTLNILI